MKLLPSDLGAVASIFLALLAMAAHEETAHADTPGGARISVVSQTDQSARLLFTATGLPRGAVLNASSTQVTVGGVRVTVDAQPVTGLQGASEVRRAVLVVDTSGSMSGPGITGARQAALSFLAAVPADVNVGLVTFSDRPHVVAWPALSRARVRAALSRLRVGGETSLYDGVAVGLRVLGSSGDRALIVLSDGRDTRSRESQAAILLRLRQSGVRLDAVAFNTNDAVRRVLEAMAEAAGGEVTSARDASALVNAFSTEAQRFGSQLTVDIVVPQSLRGRTVPLDVSVSSSAGVLRASMPVRFGAITPVAPGSATKPTGGSSGPPLVALILLFLGISGAAHIGLNALVARRSPETRTRQLLSRYTSVAETTVRTEKADGQAKPTIASRTIAFAERMANSPGRRDKLTLRLARANVAMTPGEWLVSQSLLVCVVAISGVFLFRTIAVGVVLAVVAYFGSNVWLSIKGRRRLRAFDEHLPNSLQLVASSLRSGFSLAQALDGVVREGVEPVSEELHRALAEARLGVPIEDALDGIAQRMDSTDFQWVVMAIRIQHEVGGNLAEVLLNTAEMMRDRARLRRQVKALSAEGRLSAYVLLALPIVMTLYMVTLRRAYIRPLYTTPPGIAMIIVGLGLVLVGALWMRKVVKVDV